MFKLNGEMAPPSEGNISYLLVAIDSVGQVTVEYPGACFYGHC